MSDLKTVLEKNRKNHKNGKLWKFLAALILFAVAVGGVYAIFFAKNAAGAYEMVKVRRQNLIESVEITGNVEAGATVKLGFRQSGQLAKINFETGDDVEKDQIIAELESSDQKLRVERAKAFLAAAQANLNQKLAGNTAEAIEIAEAGVAKMFAARDKTELDLENAREEFDLTVQKLEEDLKRQQLVVDDAKEKYDYTLQGQTITGNISQQTVEAAKSDLNKKILATATQIQQTLINLETVIVNDGNNALGSDINRFEYKYLNPAQIEYFRIKSEFDPIYLQLGMVSGQSVDQLILMAENLSGLGYDLLQASKLVTDGLSQLGGSSSLAESTIESLKSLILSDSNLLTSSLVNLNLGIQTLIDARLGQTSGGVSAKNYYEQQLQVLESLKVDQLVMLNTKETAIESLESQLKIQEADLNSAQANLNEIKAPPRNVDIAYLRAQVAAANVDLLLAQAELDKTLLKAPMNGVLTRKNIEEGEQYTFLVSENFVPVFEMISASKFKIDANIAEVDIGKIKAGDKVTIILDALSGRDFAGTIVSVDPVETKIQDVVYYKAEVVFDEQDEDIKPGMSADVDIVLSEANGVLTIPERALIRENGDVYVRVLQGGAVSRIKVKTGIRSLTGDIEIKEGLSEGQEIILRSR